MLNYKLFLVLCCVYENIQAFSFRSPAEWAIRVVSGSLSDSPHFHEPEKGFDLDENEMKKFHVWPMGVIPYYIDNLSFGKALKDTIRLYLNNVNQVTGLRFTEIPRPPEDEESRWVLFINRRGQLGCADLPFSNFTNKGVQGIVLGYDCLANGKMGAVVLSLIGVPPQHNAPDRDKFIEVVKENILPDKLHLFDMLKDDEWLFFDIDYDSESAGHFDPHQYTSNGGETIKFKSNQAENLTKRSTTGFTVQDIKKIQMLYNYITKKRDTSIKVPGCDKLFAPGSNLSNFQPNVSDEVKPRKKPNRYLGNKSKTENEISIEINDDNKNSTSSHQIQEDNMQIDLSQIPQDKINDDNTNSTNSHEIQEDNMQVDFSQIPQDKIIDDNTNSTNSHEIQEDNMQVDFSQIPQDKIIDDNTNSTNSHQIQEDNMEIDLSQIPQDKNIKLLSHKLSKKVEILQESDFETDEEKRRL